MKRIPLSQGKYTLVDDEDFEELNKHKWYYADGYAKRNIKLPNGKRRQELMHRRILQPPADKFIDHINMDGLDNRKQNLRTCTHSENLMNKGRHKKGSSKYKGVALHKSKRHKKNKWIAHICKDNKRMSLGYFHTEKQAAIAYNNAALKIHGEFARLNEVEDEMDFTQYQNQAARTIPKDKWLNTMISNFSMGLAGETGEVVDYLKKVYHHDHDLDKEVITKELGDVMWYLSGLATMLGINLEDVAVQNIEKLKKRYPEGFDTTASKERVE